MHRSPTLNWYGLGQMRFAAAIENLADHRYREVGSGIDGSGLNAVLGVMARY